MQAASNPNAAAAPQGDSFIPVSSFFGKLFHGGTKEIWPSIWIAAAAGIPFLIVPVVEGFRLELNWIIWLLEGYFSLLIAAYFYRLSGVSPALMKKGLGFFAFTMLIGIPLLFQAQERWPIVKQIYSQTNAHDLGSGMLGFVLGVGVFEELCKALPLLVFCVGRGPIKSKDAVFLGLMSGLGFAFSEGGLYTALNAAQAVTTDIEQTLASLGTAHSQTEFAAKLKSISPELIKFHLTGIVTHVVRLISLPVLHGAWAGCVGWFVARSVKLNSWHSIAIGIGIVAVLHGMYDVIVVGFMGPGIASEILALILMLFAILLFASHLLGHDENSESQS